MKLFKNDIVLHFISLNIFYYGDGFEAKWNIGYVSKLFGN